MPDKIKVLIIDDEALARDLVKKYLDGVAGVEVSGECADGFEALKMIRELSPDLLFLDIQMPRINGFELLEVLDPRPRIIFTTAFDQYAIRAFEMNAVDYLLKPFSKDRLIQALEKAMSRIGMESLSTGTPSHLNQLQHHLDIEKKTLERVVTRLGNKITVIPVEKIHFVAASDDYVMIHSELGSHLKEKTMKYFEEHLPAGQFVRIHRSHIVNISVIKTLELYSKDSYVAILNSGERLKVSADGYRKLREKF